MNIIQVSDYQKLSEMAAVIIAGQILRKPSSVLGLATGSTPLGIYERLVKLYQEKCLNFSQVTSFNLDEYCGLDPQNHQSYHYYMQNHLFFHINMDETKFHIPNGLAEDIEAECKAYDEKIKQAGGIDLQILGIGHNGHIGFNEPAHSFLYGTHQEILDESTIKASSRFFEDISQVPTTAISMGIGTIMEAKSILLVASEGKQEIIQKTVYGPIDPQVPASLLQLHKDVTVVYVG
ncbi:glucosamine-6-phosphate deaminase [Clostridia bacterium]|nr:glucosamine-6-phosphate deaminase [Clostridia bacterium]